MRDLFPHNQKAFEAVMKAFGEGKQRACIVHATGSGKSYCIAAVAEQFNRVLILAPMSFVLDETRKVCGGNVEFRTYSSLLYSIPTDRYDLIVLDEFHRTGAEQWGIRLKQLFDMNPDARIFGVTATPVRDNDCNRDMCDDMFDGNVVSRLTISDAMRRGILPKPKAYICGAYTFDDTKKKYTAHIKEADMPEKKRKELLKRLSSIQSSWAKSEGVPSILRQYFDPSYHKRVVVFVPFIAKMEETIRQTRRWFREAGIEREIKTYRLDSSMSDADLSDTMAGYCTDKGDILKIAFAVNMLNEGVHVPGVDCVICLRSTGSRIIMYQQFGRCLAAGGRQPLILDLVSNLDRLQGYSPVDIKKQESSTKSYTASSENRNSSETEEMPFEIISVGKDMLRELDALNTDILGYHTDDEILQKMKELAPKYGNIAEMEKDYAWLVQQFRKRFGTKELHKYIEPARKKEYPFEECMSAASRYSSPAEWKASPDAKYYTYTRKHKDYMDRIYTSMDWNIRTSRTLDECLESARQYGSYTEWSEKESATYSYAVKKGYNKEIMRQVFPDARRLYDSYTKAECAEIAKGYSTPKALRLGNTGAWEAMRKNGWIIELCAHMDDKLLNPYRPQLTHDECKVLALEYKTKKAMRIGNFYLLNTIVKNHWEDEMFAHFPRSKSSAS